MWTSKWGPEPLTTVLLSRCLFPFNLSQCLVFSVRYTANFWRWIITSVFCVGVCVGGDSTPTGYGSLWMKASEVRNMSTLLAACHLLPDKKSGVKHHCRLSFLFCSVFQKQNHKNRRGICAGFSSFASLKMKPLFPLFHMPLLHIFHTLEWYIEGRNGKKTAMQWNFNQRLLLL